MVKTYTPDTLTLEQVSTDTCSTEYKVVYNGQEYDLRLWIIVGGTPALQVSKTYVKEWEHNLVCREYAPSRRFEPTPEVRERWDSWSNSRRGAGARRGCFVHQDPDHLQGPVVEEVLPNGLEDVRVYLATTDLEDLDHAQERAAEKYRWETFCKLHRLPSKDKWPVRDLEEEPRVLPGTTLRDGRHLFWASDLPKALKGLLQHDAVQFLGCILSPTVLRQVASAFGRDSLEAWTEDGELYIESQDAPVRRLHFLDGAGDKYLGRNGVNAILEVR